MAADLFIAGDWGTSVMRLYLCKPAGNGGAPEIVGEMRGPGIKAGGNFEAALFEAAAAWLADHGSMPIVLGGMIGSTIGWREVPYVHCPAGPAAIVGGAARFSVRGADVTIAPGLTCTNIFGLPDVLRGEEVQILGFDAAPHEGAGHHLVCLPGTHAKWVFTHGQEISGFFTSMQGELHEVMLGHSVLGRTVKPSEVFDEAAFSEGLKRMRGDQTLSLEHALFSVRSRIVLGDLRADAGTAYLSGLLIGADVRDALAACAERDLAFHAVVLIGSDRLVDLYAKALAVMQRDVPIRRMTDQEASVRGLARLLQG